MIKNIIKTIACLATVMALAFSMQIRAAEIYTPGIYQDPANGRQFLLSGANAANGRTVWTLVSMYNIDLIFNGIWETGPAVGNSILAGTSNIVTFPNGYAAGRSYGVIGINSFTANWPAGNFLAASQSTTTLTVASLSASGATNASFNLNLISQGAPVAASAETFTPGVYRDSSGFPYQLSGAPSQTGRTVWTLSAMEGNPNTMNAIWETGAAIGNNIVGVDSAISTSPAGYAAGRSYGKLGSNSWQGWWRAGYTLAAVQCGNQISLTVNNTAGASLAEMGLTRDSSVISVISSGSENFVPGYYRDSSGHRYLVSGSTEVGRGRTVWSIASVGQPIGFNAVWETGAAVGNNIIGVDSAISTSPAAYAAGRSYGILGSNNWAGAGWWRAGYTLAAVQAGNTIAVTVNGFSNNTAGSSLDVQVLTQENGTTGVVGLDSEAYLAGTDYQDVNGNTYTVAGSGNSWAITGTGAATFNASFQTGAASANPNVAASNLISSPAAYAAGRSYGILGSNNWAGAGWWRAGYTLAAVQAGNTIAVTVNGFSNNTAQSSLDVAVLTKGVGGIGGAGSAQFSSTSYLASTLNGRATIGVERTDGGTGMASVTYSTSDGTAISGTDYTAAQGGVLAWAAGDTAIKYISVAIPTTARANTKFNLTLSGPVGMTVGAQSSATVTIIDNLQSVTNLTSADRVMNWAERLYPTLFPHNSTIITLPAAPYTYRYYPTTGLFLASDGPNVILHGGSWNLSNVGTVASLLTTATTAGY